MSDDEKLEPVLDYKERFGEHYDAAGRLIPDAPVMVDRGPLKGLAVSNGYLYVKPYKKVTQAGLVVPNPDKERETRFVVYGASSGMWDNGVFRKSYLKVGDVVMMDPVRANQRGGLSDFTWGSERYLCAKIDCVSSVVTVDEPDVARIVKPNERKLTLQ